MYAQSYKEEVVPLADKMYKQRTSNDIQPTLALHKTQLDCDVGRNLSVSTTIQPSLHLLNNCCSPPPPQHQWLQSVTCFFLFFSNYSYWYALQCFFGQAGCDYRAGLRGSIFIGMYVVSYVGSGLMLRYTEGATYLAVVQVSKIIPLFLSPYHTTLFILSNDSRRHW